MRQPANSTNQKTIGINKLGTLLSSQTTAATGTKHNQTVMSSLRSNFTSLPPQPRSRKSAPRPHHRTKPAAQPTNKPTEQTTNPEPPPEPCTARDRRTRIFIKGGLSPTPGQLHNYTSTPPREPNRPHHEHAGAQNDTRRHISQGGAGSRHDSSSRRGRLYPCLFGEDVLLQGARPGPSPGPSLSRRSQGAPPQPASCEERRGVDRVPAPPGIGCRIPPTSSGSERSTRLWEEECHGVATGTVGHKESVRDPSGGGLSTDDGG